VILYGGERSRNGRYRIVSTGIGRETEGVRILPKLQLVEFKLTFWYTASLQRQALSSKHLLTYLVFSQQLIAQPKTAQHIVIEKALSGTLTWCRNVNLSYRPMQHCHKYPECEEPHSVSKISSKMDF
jgi:hypothetical protein